METIGYAVFLVGYFWIVVLAFQRSILWGIGSFLIPIVALIFALMERHQTSKALVLCAIGFGLILLATP